MTNPLYIHNKAHLNRWSWQVITYKETEKRKIFTVFTDKKYFSTCIINIFQEQCLTCFKLHFVSIFTRHLFSSGMMPFKYFLTSSECLGDVSVLFTSPMHCRCRRDAVTRRTRQLSHHLFPVALKNEVIFPLYVTFNLRTLFCYMLGIRTFLPINHKPSFEGIFVFEIYVKT
jgi:hypothetical protein